MSAIVIRRCTMRVTRRGGWSWGEDRRSLAERMTALVPTLVAKRLAELFGDAPAEQDVATPLRLDVRITRAAVRDPVALADAVRRALSIWQPFDGPSYAAQPAAEPSVGITPAISQIARESGTVAELAAQGGSAILGLLSAWREAGMMGMNVAALPETVAAAWSARITDNAPVAIGKAVPTGDLERVIEALVAAMSVPLAVPGARQRARLLATAEWLLAYGSLPPAGAFATQLEASLARRERRLRGADPQAIAASGGQAPALDRLSEVEAATIEAQGRSPAMPRLARWAPVARDVALASVLPFLTLGMLHRIGWLDIAAASLEGIGGDEDGAYLAAAIAEVLMVPALVRRAGPDAIRRNVAFFAGLDAPPSTAAMTDWGERHRAHLGPIATFIATTIAEGHDPARPIVLLRGAADAAAPFVLVDCDGMYPVAVGDQTECVRTLSRFRASPLLVARDAATPPLLAALQAEGHSWATDVPPGRGEAGERLRGGEPLWVAGDMPPARLRAAAAEFSTMTPLARECCARLLRGTAPLDHNAFLAAGMGLGLLAWMLWRDREPVDPLLALDRLADLDGIATIDADCIEIRPAIGRRYLDLRDRGALVAIPRIPWLGGRSVRFAGP